MSSAVFTCLLQPETEIPDQIGNPSSIAFVKIGSSAKTVLNYWSVEGATQNPVISMTIVGCGQPKSGNYSLGMGGPKEKARNLRKSHETGSTPTPLTGVLRSIRLATIIEEKAGQGQEG